MKSYVALANTPDLAERPREARTMEWGRLDPEVERAMQRVPRKRFLPADQQAHAAEDTALPIECSQTISQPSLVAHMTEQLELTPRSRVLEIGTGSGYQTAILAELAGEVFTIERFELLSRTAQVRLRSLGYTNIRFRIGDGAKGWPEHAPFDAIIVTAAPEILPPDLVSQLKPGGRMVAPIGPAHADDQVLVLVEKDEAGMVTQRELCSVRFVPLVSDRVPE